MTKSDLPGQPLRHPPPAHLPLLFPAQPCSCEALLAVRRYLGGRVVRLGEGGAPDGGPTRPGRGDIGPRAEPRETSHKG
jgi:hypothetical protein